MMGTTFKKFAPWIIAGVMTIVAIAAVARNGASPTSTVAASGSLQASASASASASPLPAAAGAEEPSEAPSPEASAIGTSLDNPVPVGSSAQLGTWQVEVVGYTKNADAAVAHENQFNDKPKPGTQYVLVTLKATYTGNGSSDPSSDLTSAGIGSDGTQYGSPSEVLPDDLYDVGNVPSGAHAVGNVVLLVDSSAVDGLVVYLEGYTASFDTEGAFFAVS
jgi:hypothetical protein